MKGISFLFLLTFLGCTHPDTPKVPINAKDHQYKQCYNESDSYRDSKAIPKGQVTIGFTLQPDGKIEDEKILATDFKDANFHACLLMITRELELPKPTADTMLTKKLKFSSQTKSYEE